MKQNEAPHCGAGDEAAAKLAERLIGEGIDCYRIQFPKGMDANEYAMKVQLAAKSLGVAIRKAQWLGQGKPKAVISTVCVASDDVPAADTASSLVAAVAVEESAVKENPAAAAPVEPLLASPVPVLPPVPVEVGERDVTLTLGERRYRVRGLAKNLAYDTLKVNVLVSLGERFYVDTFDLYAARAWASYTTQAAVELGVAEDVNRRRRSTRTSPSTSCNASTQRRIRPES